MPRSSILNKIESGLQHQRNAYFFNEIGPNLLFADQQTPRRNIPLAATQAALVASHHNPDLAIFADRLRAAGKPDKVIITAVARKLVTIANALCKSRQIWTSTVT